MYKISTLLPLALILGGTPLLAQDMEKTKEEKKAPNGWHLLDREKDGFQGISLDKAYEHVKAQKLKSKKVIVAVIDSGIDTLHEDLKPVLWTNKKEIPGNGKDDDKNGYVDDIHGWNFLGGKDGRNVKQDSYEGARQYHILKPVWEGKAVDEATLTPAEKASYQTYLRAKEKTVSGVNEEEIAFIKNLFPKYQKGDSLLRLELGKQEYNGNDLKNSNPADPDAKAARQLLLGISKANDSYEISNQQILDEFQGQLRKADAAVTPPPAFRKDIVGDDESNINDRFYGNNDIMASTPFHGTHCSGIIGAAWNNGKGSNGVADNVEIMMLRAVPDGDEHDKDIALAIRYAVDNGARVINMSFGKDFSPQKEWVDEAFRYAESKGVLLVHAAGNDAKNIDTAYNFPNPVYVNGKGRASNVITVGASGDPSNGGITANFSNYGKKEVDVFAPGVAIYATIPGGNTYGNSQGTSMAGPVVAGIAAMILQYYPSLNPQQVKYVIEQSVTAPAGMVKKPGTDEMVNLADISKTGGVVNAYEAIKLAGTIQQKKTLPKTEVKKKTLN